MTVSGSFTVYVTFLAKSLPLPKLLADDVQDLLGVVVVLREDERLGDVVGPGKISGRCDSSETCG